MATPIWSGYLTFGLISIPVKLYSGSRSEHISFNMLHRDDLSRIKQQLHCPECNMTVDRDAIVKGYEYKKGEYIVIEPSEIKQIEPKTAAAMEILEFVKIDDVDPIYFESSYHLVPEEAGVKAFSILREAMNDMNKFAVAKITMHNREYTVLIRPYLQGLLLHTLFYEDEIRPVPEYKHEPLTEQANAEVKVAYQLIEALTGTWDMSKYSDTFQENLKGLIKARLEGRELEKQAVEEEVKKPLPNIIDSLKASIKAAQERRKK